MADTLIPFPPRPGIRRPDPAADLGRLAEIHAEQVSSLNLEHAAFLIDHAADTIETAQRMLITRAQAVKILRTLARHVRDLKEQPPGGVA